MWKGTACSEKMKKKREDIVAYRSRTNFWLWETEFNLRWTLWNCLNEKYREMSRAVGYVCGKQQSRQVRWQGWQHLHATPTSLCAGVSGRHWRQISAGARGQQKWQTLVVLGKCALTLKLGQLAREKVPVDSVLNHRRDRLLGMVVMDQWLDKMILAVFPNCKDSMNWLDNKIRMN